jgi:hypothetical protein
VTCITIWPKPLAFSSDSVQPFGQPASISSAPICSPVRPGKERWTVSPRTPPDPVRAGTFAILRFLGFFTL